MKTTKTINKEWDEYDKAVAQAQLNNYNRIFLDEYGCPIDNEYELEKLSKTAYQEVSNTIKKIKHGLNTMEIYSLKKKVENLEDEKTEIEIGKIKRGINAIQCSLDELEVYANELKKVHKQEQNYSDWGYECTVGDLKEMIEYYESIIRCVIQDMSIVLKKED